MVSSRYEIDTDNGNLDFLLTSFYLHLVLYIFSVPGFTVRNGNMYIYSVLSVQVRVKAVTSISHHNRLAPKMASGKKSLRENLPLSRDWYVKVLDGSVAWHEK